MPTKFKLTVPCDPNGRLTARPYVTKDYGFIAEVYCNQQAITRATVMVDSANALPDITEAAKALLSVMRRPGMGDIHLRPWMALKEAVHAAEKAMR